jgi:hypothetical protein
LRCAEGWLLVAGAKIEPDGTIVVLAPPGSSGERPEPTRPGAQPMKRKLPKHVTAFFDRHGKERFRYRKGAVSRYLRGPFNSPEFKEDLRQGVRNAGPRKLIARRFPARSTI